MSFSATIQATLTANNSQFSAALDNSTAQVKQLEANLRRAGAMPMPGERSARDSASVFEAQARSQEKVTDERYRAMDAASAEESAIRATIRAREDAAALASKSPSTGGAAVAGSSAAAPSGLLGRFTAWRKDAKKSLESIGGAGLVKGLGVGALVAGFRAVLNNAQQTRDAAYAIGAALDPAVERTAEIADNLDRAQNNLMQAGATLLSGIQRGLDYAVAGIGVVLGYGSFNENLGVVDKGNEADIQAKKQAAQVRERKRLAAEEADAQKALADAELQVAEARLALEKESASTETKIAVATTDVSEAQKAVTAAKAGTLDHAKAELELVSRQSELADLQRQREAEITTEKEKQVAVEAQLAKQREEANAKLSVALAKQQAAVLAVQAARQAYATALSDQSAATLSEVASGQRGSPADQRKAAEVERLRAQARQARDAGRLTVRGGQAVSVADELSTRANQVQSGIKSLNTSERDPLAGVEAQLKQANDELSQIRTSLTLMEVDG